MKVSVSEGLFMGVGAFAINMPAFEETRKCQLGVQSMALYFAEGGREACHLGGEGVGAVVRETSDSDRRNGSAGHWRVPEGFLSPVTARCCSLGVGRKKVSVGPKAHSSWCLGCRRSQAQLI